METVSEIRLREPIVDPVVTASSKMGTPSKYG